MLKPNNLSMQSIIINNEEDAPTLTAITASMRRYLVVQPRPDAAATAKASLFPWLYVLGHDLWHPHILHQVDLKELLGENANNYNLCRYRLQHDQQTVTIDVWGVGESLSRSPARDIRPTLSEETRWAIRTNGSDWQFSYLDNGGLIQRYSFSIFDENFQEAIYHLFTPTTTDSNLRINNTLQAISQGILRQAMDEIIKQDGKDILRDKEPEEIRDLLSTKNILEEDIVNLLSNEQIRTMRDYQLSATDMGFIRPAQPLTAINLENIEHHAQMVSRLRGNLQATFDDTPIDISSRTGFYYILAAIAVQFNRLDAIPAKDLIRPPDSPPDNNRVRPLGKPGWYLDLTASAEELDTNVSLLLDALNLRYRFKALNRGEAFPQDLTILEL